MSKPILIIMSGSAGSGKSTAAIALSEKYSATIVSSDLIRQELYGKDYVYDASDNKEVFSTLEKRIVECGQKGKNVIMDSTNLVRKYRELEYKKYRSLFQVMVYQIVAPLEILLSRNKSRAAKEQVPEEVVHRMFHSLEQPIVGVDCDSFKIIEVSKEEQVMNRKKEVVCIYRNIAGKRGSLLGEGSTLSEAILDAVERGTVIEFDEVSTDDMEGFELYIEGAHSDYFVVRETRE